MARSETPDAKLPAANVSSVLRIAAIVLRTILICILLTLTVRVSLPQSETIWTAYETPADLIRFWFPQLPQWLLRKFKLRRRQSQS